MLSRRRFLFGAVASPIALSVSQSLAGNMASALLSPSPAPAVAADIVQGVHSTYTLLGEMTGIARSAMHASLSAERGYNRTDASRWHRDYNTIVMDYLTDLASLMNASRMQNLEAERLKVHEICMRHKALQDLHPVNYDGPLDLMDKFASRETILAQIPETLERTLLTLADAEKARPPGLQSRPVTMNQMHMVLKPHESPVLQNAPTYCGRGSFFEEHTHGLYYTYTPDNLKFLAELKFLQYNNFLARVFTLPEREQAILDVLEANPANWAQLLKNQSYAPDGKATVNRLNATFPERAEKVKIYEAAIESAENSREVLSWKGQQLPWIDVPWNIVAQMHYQPDAFMPIMQAALDESKEHFLKSYRDYFSRACKGKTTFTQTASDEADAQVIQGVLRGVFVVFPDKKAVLDIFKSSFSEAVNLVVQGEDILLEAKPEMNEQDRLLFEDLSGVKMDQVAFAMPLKEPVPVL